MAVAVYAPGTSPLPVADDDGRYDDIVWNADPDALLTGARAAAARMWRRQLVQTGLFRGLIVSGAVVVWCGVVWCRGYGARKSPPITNVFFWARMYWVFSRVQGAAVADLRHARLIDLSTWTADASAAASASERQT